MTLEYSKTVPFARNRARALDVARSAFVGQSFQIVASGDSELRVKGPGISSTRENPLKGLSEASITVRADSIEVSALLSNMSMMGRDG